jgi:hypothetical protein
MWNKPKVRNLCREMQLMTNKVAAKILEVRECGGKRRKEG